MKSVEDESICLKTEKKEVTWPFWIQVPAILSGPASYHAGYMQQPDLEIEWLANIKYVLDMAIILSPLLLCPLAGILGLTMNGKMKKLREGTIILSVINLAEFVLALLFFLVLYAIANISGI